MNKAKTLLLAIAMYACLFCTAQSANRFAVLITEIMADPTPAVGLPNAEYIELRNTSSFALPLTGWRLSDRSSSATLTTSFVLPPDSLVILCANSNVAAFSAFGRTIGVSSFPSLDNEDDELTLRSPQGSVIHAVAYTSEWYGNEAKRDGGWSLEMIDPQNPCTGKENWKGSTDDRGGTPGRPNAANGSNADNTPPQLKRASATDNTTVVLLFNESLDSSSASLASNYLLPGNTVVTATPLPPLFQSVQLTLSSPLQANVVSMLRVTNITDCKGNTVGGYNTVKIGLPQVAAQSDVVVNEILCNPKPNGFDYVEFFNRGNKVIDASKLYIGNRSSSGAVASLRRLTGDPVYLFPGDYLVITENKENLQMQYLVKNEEAVLALSSLPSFPADKGTVVLQSLNGALIDEVSYHKDWHFALLGNDEGVALERIDPDKPSQEKSNWHSAASTAGYGTPGYRNSQFKNAVEMSAAVVVSPTTFSPDNDGRDDIATVSYQVEAQGYVANVFVFDAGGRLVRQLVKNDLLALKGSWNWDGLGETGNKLPIGRYIVVTEIFHPEGKKKSFKNTIVLARPLK